MRTLLSVSALLSLLLLNGCLGADTSDPRKGGLFGYSPSTYESRLKERQDRLDAIDEDTAKARAQSASLEQSKKAKQAKLNAQRKKLSAELSTVSGKVERAKAHSGADKARVNDLVRRKNAVQKESRTLPDLTDAEKEAKIREMRRELKELEAEAEALSRM